MSTKKLIVIISFVCLLLLGTIGGIVWYITSNKDISIEDLLPSTSDEEESTESVSDDEDYVYSNEDYAEMIVQTLEYELISTEEVPITYEERKVDPDSDLPPYIQEYTPVSTQLYETLQSTVEKVQNEQNYSADLWRVTSDSRVGHKAEVSYEVVLSTEVHYYKFVAGIDEETGEGNCVVQVFRKVVIPEVG